MRKAWMFLMALVIAGAAQAQMYKWVDEEGKARFGDQPPPGVKATPIKRVRPGPVLGPAQASGDAGRAPQAPEMDSRRQAEPSASEKSAQEAQKRAVQPR